MTKSATVSKTTLRIIASTFLIFLPLTISAQKVIDSGILPGATSDSISCLNNTALYRAYYLNKDYDRALDHWRLAVAGCPAYSEEIYSDGESMYRELYSQTGDMACIDSILKILNQRAWYFNKRLSIELHKAELLFDLAGDDPVFLGLCYNILRESAESFPDEMDCSHFVMSATAAASLYSMDIIDSEELSSAFVEAIMILASRLENKVCDNAFSEDLKNLELYFRTSGSMTCSSIETLYSQKIEKNFRDTALINAVYSMLNEAGCSGSDFYYSVAVRMFANDRSAENAVRLAELNLARNNTERAISYFTEAYNRDTSRLVRSEVITRVAAMELAQGKRQEARDRAEHAWQLNNRNAKALMILADCYAGAELGSSFDNHTAYWVAVDYLEAAMKVDPSLKKEAEGKIKTYSRLFPTREECFYRRILDEGTVFNVGSWINEVTRVRFRKE